MLKKHLLLSLDIDRNRLLILTLHLFILLQRDFVLLKPSTPSDGELDLPEAAVNQ